ncbi:MAG: TIGR01777 family oxidoreductase [Parachlamydia sp.]|nr:TIGR01777 family oxidoreductase [Parachlamydia sp.]
MRVMVTGATGLVGSALVAHLRGAGHSVTKLVRHPHADDERKWDPAEGQINLKDLEGFEGIVNLAGESIASGRWTMSKKKRILESRISSTRILVETFAKMASPPAVLINASAIGYYGDRGEEPLTEESSSGDGFLADVCRQWEAAAEPASKLGMRVVALRTGIVLAKEGGALAKMIIPFKLGLGGVVASGSQYMSWIAIDDLVRIIAFLLTESSLKGAFNAVGPAPATNRDFTKTLGEVLHRPTFMPMPALAIKFLLGEMGQEMLLNSQKVLPERLQKAGYAFAYPDLNQALAHIIS